MKNSERDPVLTLAMQKINLRLKDVGQHIRFVCLPNISVAPKVQYVLRMFLM